MKEFARVLIVDDRQVVRQTVKSTLLGFNCVFEEAGDGATGLSLMERQEFDVIFLDLKLPDLSGIDVLGRARRFDERVLGKVIITTGFPDAKTRMAAEQLGAFRYLTKNPLDWDEVRKTFAEAMSTGVPTPPVSVLKLDSPEAVQRTNTIPHSISSHDSRPRLLVLDDNPDWLDHMERVLGDEFRLEKTARAEEALRLVVTENFGLVVLDLKLDAGRSGLDVLSQMRRTNPVLRAIILTGFPSDSSILKAGQRGALDYVNKSDVLTLPGRIHKILAAAPIRVFLSYDRTDLENVKKLFDRLTEEGFLPWMDIKSIGPGKQWEPAIRKAIAHSDRFVYCLSNHSLFREGMMRKELKWAFERQDGLLDDSVFFIAARLEDCPVLGKISEFQYVDLFMPDGFNRLAEALSYGGHDDA